MKDCFTLLPTKEHCSHNAFMGLTHASSGLLFSALLVLTPSLWNYVTDGNPVSLPLLIGVTISVIAGSLLPDLDNQQSTALSALGVIGLIIQKFFFATSLVVQNIIRLPKDEITSNPHRKLWHTPFIWILNCFLFGFLLSWLNGLTFTYFVIPYLGAYTGVSLLMILMLTLNSVIAFKVSLVKILKGKVTAILSYLLAAVLSVWIVASVPADGYWWLVCATAFGALVHIAGDTCTTMGAPLLFPIPIKGKFWFNVRLSPMKAGGLIDTVLCYLFLAVGVALWCYYGYVTLL